MCIYYTLVALFFMLLFWSFSSSHPMSFNYISVKKNQTSAINESYWEKQFGGHGECYPSCELGNSWSLSSQMCCWLSDEHWGICWIQFSKGIDLDLWHKISIPERFWHFIFYFIFSNFLIIIFKIICAEIFIKLGIWKIILLWGLNHRP
jgi:hypothetical protein